MERSWAPAAAGHRSAFGVGHRDLLMLSAAMIAFGVVVAVGAAAGGLALFVGGADPSDLD